MKAKIAGIGVALLLVTAGAAAPGNVPGVSNADESNDENEASESDGAR